MFIYSRSNIFPVFIFFLISFIFRFFCSDFFKHLSGYPDELFYYQIAENFAHSRGLMVYNHLTSFQKILYPFILSPSFLVQDRELQQHILSLINSFLICSSIFPTYFIAKKILKNNKNILFITFFSILLPDLSYSITFMSENLFLPLSLWLIYFFLKLLEKNHIFQPIYSIFLGLFCYLSYLCKEIALFFPFSFLGTIFIFHILKSNNDELKNSLKNILLIILTFLTFYFVFDFLFFNSLHNFYTSQLNNKGIIPVEEQLPFFIFCFFNFIISVFLASLFLPFIFPILFWKEIKIIHQKFFIFLILLLLGTALTMSYSIYIREMDFFLPAPRSLLRYVSYIWIPILCLFLSFIEYPLTNKKNKLFLLSLFFSLVLFFIYKGSYGIVRVDNMMLSIFDVRSPILYAKILFCFFVLFSSLFFHKFKNKIIYLTLTILACSFIYQNYINNTELKYQYSVKENARLEIENIEKFIESQPNKNFFILNNRWWFDEHQALSDTFFNYPNVFTSHVEYFLKENEVDRHKIPLLWLYPNDSGKFYHFTKIDYIILPQDIRFTSSNQPQLSHSNFQGFYIEDATLLPKQEEDKENLFFIFQLHYPQTFPRIGITFASD